MKILETNITNNNGYVVVIGASAGGMEALCTLVSQLGEDFPAPVLIVQHISEDASGNFLLKALQQAGKLKCMHAIQGEPVKAGCVYLAPSGHHMLVHGDGKLQVTKGAQKIAIARVLIRFSGQQRWALATR